MLKKIIIMLGTIFYYIEIIIPSDHPHSAKSSGGISPEYYTPKSHFESSSPSRDSKQSSPRGVVSPEDLTRQLEKIQKNSNQLIDEKNAHKEWVKKHSKKIIAGPALTLFLLRIGYVFFIEKRTVTIKLPLLFQEINVEHNPLLDLKTNTIVNQNSITIDEAGFICAGKKQIVLKAPFTKDEYLPLKIDKEHGTEEILCGNYKTKLHEKETDYCTYAQLITLFETEKNNRSDEESLLFLKEPLENPPSVFLLIDIPIRARKEKAVKAGLIALLLYVFVSGGGLILLNR